MSIISRLQIVQIMSQGKITESSYIRKATASINVLITAIIRNRNIMQPFKITHVHPTGTKRRTKFNRFKQVMWTRKVK